MNSQRRGIISLVTDDAYKVFYDGRCRICLRSRQMIQRLAASGTVIFIDVHDRQALQAYPQLRGADTRGQMHVIDPAGRLTGGFDALVALMPLFSPISAFAPLFRRGPLRSIGARVYRWLANNRYRLGGDVSCEEGACQFNL